MNNYIPCFLLGDFNCDLETEDRQDLSSLAFTGRSSPTSTALSDLIISQDMHELYQPDYTRAPHYYDDFHNRRGCAARLDRIYCKNLDVHNLSIFTYANPFLTLDNETSDHCIVFSKISPLRAGHCRRISGWVCRHPDFSATFERHFSEGSLNATNCWQIHRAAKSAAMTAASEIKKLSWPQT